MPESESRAPQVYDREAEFPHDETRSGRRRRPVADWGGDELFTRMPRRRSAHAVGQRRFVRSDADAEQAPDGLGMPLDDVSGDQRDAPAEPPDAWHLDPPGEPGAVQGVELSDAPGDAWAVDLFAARESQDGGSRAAGTSQELPPVVEPAAGGHDAPWSAAGEAGDDAIGGVPGRRTAVIGRRGRAERAHLDAPFASVSRRRPPPTVAERIGGQPDRIVGWAFALGLILILIAIATAHA